MSLVGLPTSKREISVRLAFYVALAFLMYWAGREPQAAHYALLAYIAAIGSYWYIQLVTKLQNPLNGVSVVSLLASLSALIVPALAKAS